MEKLNLEGLFHKCGGSFVAVPEEDWNNFIAAIKQIKDGNVAAVRIPDVVRMYPQQGAPQTAG